MEIKKKKGISAKIEPLQSLKSNEVASAPQMKAKEGGAGLSIRANLQAAKKAKPKMEGEVSLGPTEAQEYSPKYIDRIKKRAAK
jgi:hypothetical protein